MCYFLRGRSRVARAALLIVPRASLGADLEAISPETFSLMLAGAVISIVIALPLHGYGNPLAAWIGQKFSESELSRLPASSDTTQELRGHAIICGYGRVGHVVGEALLGTLDVQAILQRLRIREDDDGRS
jgi:hypothetical protein